MLSLDRNETREDSKLMLQILAPDGGLAQGAQEPPIETEDLLSAYKTMCLVRALDERFIGLQRQGRLGTYVSCSGQEASQIGAAMALGKNDWIFPMYRDMAMILQMGVPLETLMNRVFGNAEDDALGRDLPNLYGWRRYKIVSFAAPIASHVPLAVGFALAAKLRKEGFVTLSTFGDGATSSGEFHAAMNFAGVYRAPTIFVCENNQYAISVPVNKQTASETIAVKSKAYGFDGMRVDGNDLLAVYSAVGDAAKKARSGRGPTLVECVTYRLGAHSTADDWKKYRSPEEVEHWRQRDPITRLRLYLENKRKIWSKDKEYTLKSEIEKKISEALLRAEPIRPPEVESLFEDVYASMPWNLKESLQELTQVEAGVESQTESERS